MLAEFWGGWQYDIQEAPELSRKSTEMVLMTRWELLDRATPEVADIVFFSYKSQ